MKNSQTTLSTDLLRRLALMQHLGEDYFIIDGRAFKGTIEEANEGIEGFEDEEEKPSLITWCEDNLEEVEELDPENYDNDYLVLTDEEADEKAAEYIKDSLWAFNAGFIIEHSKLPYEAKEMVQTFQEQKCESANETIEALIEDIDEFIEDAIRADGRGHFMSSYDGKENEETVSLPESVTTEMIEEADIDTETTFYIYRIN